MIKNIIKIVLILNCIIFTCCSDNEPLYPPPPPLPTKLPCKVVKPYCEPDDSCDYQHIIAGFYSKNNGHIYERKAEMDESCCDFMIYYDSTLGYEETRQPLKNVIDLDSYVYVDSSEYSKDKNHVYWFFINSGGGMRHIIKDADPKTFKRIAVPSNKLSYDYRWGIDKNVVYFKGNRLEGLNVNKVQFLRIDTSDMRPDYIKDEKLVFYEYSKIEKADAKTFKLVKQEKDLDYDAVDKYRKYRYGEVFRTLNK
jgi:DKNYY family